MTSAWMGSVSWNSSTNSQRKGELLAVGVTQEHVGRPIETANLSRALLALLRHRAVMLGYRPRGDRRPDRR